MSFFTVRTSKKTLIKLAVFVAICFVGVAVAGGTARVMEDVSRSEDTNKIFNAAAELPPELVDAVEWAPDNPDLAREMEPLTRDEITSTWLRAWEQMTIVGETGNTTGVEVYFSDSAAEAVLTAAVPTGDSPRQRVHQLGHRLKVDFYSLDGQVVGLTAERVDLIRSAAFDDGPAWMTSRESYEAVLILEDGNFRVQHWVRRSAEPRWWVEPAPATSSEAKAVPQRAINYYPKAHPFTGFWANYDEATVAADLDRVVDVHADSVRIFLPFDQLGGRWTAPEDLEPVVNFMELADERELGVVVTLFDGRTDHRPSRWDSDFAHVRTVVSELKDQPALVMWDLKNEPDRDIGANGVDEQLLYSWIGAIGHELREVDSKTPTTVGWSTASAALQAPVHTDIVSFHHYGDVASFRELTPLVVDHADGRPIWLGEFGLPTYNSIFPGGHTEAEQAAYYADIMRAAQDTGVDGVAAWTLWDLDQAPGDAGSLPWNTGPQKQLGLLRVDGTPKPAAATLDPAADLTSFEVGTFNRFTGKRFWQLFWFGLGSAVCIWVCNRSLKARANRKQVANEST